MSATRKIAASIAAKLCLVLALTGFSIAATANSVPDSIKITTESWDLYTNTDGSGLFLDITRAIYEPRGIRIDLEFVPYKRALHSLENGNADAMYGTYSTEKEGKPYLFTPRIPIDKERTVAIFERDNHADWQGQTSLAKAQLAWVRGYDYHESLEVEIGDYVEVTDSRQGLTMLSAGRRTRSRESISTPALTASKPSSRKTFTWLLPPPSAGGI